MNPYIPLPSLFFNTSDNSEGQPRRSILLDIGPNNFYGSTKHLLDSYSPYLNFDEVHLVDVKEIPIPEYYNERYNISVNSDGVRVASRDEFDTLLKLKTLGIRGEDFVVLKFDVDNGSDGKTMEWGFLFDLVFSEELSLVDELYIELHFWYPELGWSHSQHNMRQSLDIFRQLRRCGLPIHSWP
jgi:hypothetical protein